MKRSFSEFLQLYREAAERLKNGDAGVEFPEGCYPPNLPFTHPKLVLD